MPPHSIQGASRQQGVKRKRSVNSQPAPAVPISPVPAPPATFKIPKDSLSALPAELRLQISSNFDNGKPEARQTLLRMVLSKSISAGAMIQLYQKVEVKVGLTTNRSHQNIELLVRSLLCNQDLRAKVKVLNIEMGAPPVTGRWDSNFCRPDDFLKGADWLRCEGFVKELCKSPLWTDHPGGRWSPSCRGRSSELAHPTSDACSSEFMARNWISALRRGRVDAWVGLLLALCENVREVEFDTYHQLMWMDTDVMGEDADWTSRVFRAGLNTQIKQLEMEQRRALGVTRSQEPEFTGVLHSLQTIHLADSKTRQCANRVFPLLALPKVRRAYLSIVDTNLPAEIFAMPDDRTIAFGLTNLVLTGSFITTANLVNLIRACPNLEVYAHQHKLLSNFTSRYDHIAELAALAETVGKKLKVLMLQITDDNYFWSKGDMNEYFAMWAGHSNPLLATGIQVETWRQFKVLRRLHAPIMYFLGWRPADNDFFRMKNQPGFNAHNFDKRYMPMPTPLVDQLPRSLETLEIMSEGYHPRDAQLYDELENVVMAAGNPDCLRNLKDIYLGEDLGGKLSHDEVYRLPKKAGDLIELANLKGVNILNYAEEEWKLPREKTGPSAQVDQAHGRPILKWKVLSDDDAELLVIGGNGTDMTGQRISLRTVEGDAVQVAPQDEFVIDHQGEWVPPPGARRRRRNDAHGSRAAEAPEADIAAAAAAAAAARANREAAAAARAARAARLSITIAAASANRQAAIEARARRFLRRQARREMEE